MAGIAGLVHLDGRPAAQEHAAAMLARLHSARPQRAASLVSGSAAFGFVTAAQGHGQPLQREGITLVFDGRLDNRGELVAQLAQRAFQANSDSEIAMQAYRCWGEDCASHFLGDFALALWDSAERKLFCARDHMGVRPFFYMHDGSRFALASRIGAILALPDVPRALNHSRVADYLVNEIDRDDQVGTMYASIQRLQPGHALTVDARGLRVRDYWQLKPPPELRLKDWREYGEALRPILVDAVRCRISEEGQTGCTLSGGLDSTSVACTVRMLWGEHPGRLLPTVSLVNADRQECVETPHIEEVLRGGGIRPIIVPSSAAPEYGAGLIEKAGSDDEPFSVGHSLWQYILIEAARAAGITVLLDGLDGDQLGVHPVIEATLLRRGRWGLAWKQASFEARLAGGSPARELWTHGIIPNFPRLYWRLRQPDVLQGLPLTPDFARSAGVADRIRDRRIALWRLSRDPGLLHVWAFRSGLVSFGLERLTALSEPCGIEMRHPYCDLRVINFFLSLPVERKLDVPLPKMVTREAMRGILPEKVRLRSHRYHPGPAFLRELLTNAPMKNLWENRNACLFRLDDFVTFHQGSYQSTVSDMYHWWNLFVLDKWLTHRDL